jgi:hypothetical protein
MNNPYALVLTTKGGNRDGVIFPEKIVARGRHFSSVEEVGLQSMRKGRENFQSQQIQMKKW